MTDLTESEGQSAFGADPDGYDNVRPKYPQWMFEDMGQQQVLLPNTRTLEIGAGTGLATRDLISHGAAPLTLIEPDRRFTSFLDPLTDHRGSACTVIYQSFEDAALPIADFDLIAIATSYHWLNPATRVDALARLLRPRGTLALLWHVFQNPGMEDPFHDATFSLLSTLPNSPSGAPDTLPFALDRKAREAELSATGLFSPSYYRSEHWTLKLTSAQTRSLYAGFSGSSRLSEEERTELLDQLESIAERQFQGTVLRNMTSVLYLFTRSG